MIIGENELPSKQIIQTLRKINSYLFYNYIIMMYEILEQEVSQLLFPEEEWIIVTVELVPNPFDWIKETLEWAWNPDCLWEPQDPSFINEVREDIVAL